METLYYKHRWCLTVQLTKTFTTSIILQYKHSLNKISHFGNIYNGTLYLEQKTGNKT